MIIDNFFITQFLDTTTAPWTPLTGITATINIWKVTGDTLTQVVTATSCTNLWGGWYGYRYTGMEASVYYIYEIVPSATAYRSGGYVDYRMQNLSMDVADIRGGGGGFSVNYSAINNHTTSKSTELKKYIDEKVDILKENHKEIYDKVNETDSHIELAKEEVIDTLEEVKPDNSEVLKGISVIKTQNTKLATYIKTESEKEKAELVKYHEKMMNDMEDAYAEMEKENEGKLNNKERLIEEMEEVSKDIVEHLEWEAEKKWIETIETIKSLLK